MELKNKPATRPANGPDLDARTTLFAARVREHFLDAKFHLAALNAKIAETEAAGMYPDVPTESWEAKKADGAKDYLYMLFKSDSRSRSGVYLGPGGQRRVAIGREPGKVAQARQMASNRVLWEKLTAARRELESWTRIQEDRLSELEQSAARWPRLAASVLGTPTAPAPGGPVPSAPGTNAGAGEAQRVPSGKAATQAKAGRR